MSAAASEPRPSRSPRVPTRAILIGVAVVVVALLALDTTYKSEGDLKATTASGRVAFDPATYGKRMFAPKVVPALEKRATDLSTLVKALRADPDAAGKRFGVRTGPSSPYNFAVRATGVAGKPKSGLMPLEVKGVKGARVSVQIGPAINGTALRDASGLITFQQFINQVDYADAATALNTQMKADVLANVHPDQLAGKQVTVLGAFTFLAPSVITLTPAKLEVRS
jgi:predicted lipoprotein